MNPVPRQRPFLQLDVFTARPYYGNPLAVILEAADLDAAAMQHIANWTNLSETIFLLPPTTPAADYRVRIFTPRSELPFAGHPSVGAAWAAVAGGRVPAAKRELVQECAAGLLPVRVEGDGDGRRIRVRAPRPRLNPAQPELLDAVGAALGARPVAAPRNILCGPWWLVCDLGEAAAVRGLRPDLERIAAVSRPLGAIGISVFGREAAGEAQYAVRAFCPGDGIAEDPVTGSANACIAAYLHASQPAAAAGLRYRASQGRELGRDGLLDVAVEADGEVSIGGQCVRCVEGTILA
ncbi:MAG TPA: PhzF family phenazine biosynthesis protein [Nevskia sp.]|nr:PhzF family phenazine biosynthesis protein [Nevskia sp.]